MKLLLRILRPLTATTILLLTLTNVAFAHFVILKTPKQFSGHEELLTFEGVKAFEKVAFYRGVHFQQVGAGPAIGLEGAFDPSTPREFGPNEGTIVQTLLGALPNGAARDVQILFPKAINRFGFEFLTSFYPGQNAKILFKLYSSGKLIKSFTLLQRNKFLNYYYFYGFQSPEAFDQIVIRGPGDSDRRVVMDNLRFERAHLGG